MHALKREMFDAVFNAVETLFPPAVAAATLSAATDLVSRLVHLWG